MMIATGDERRPRRRSTARWKRRDCSVIPLARCGPSSASGSRRRRCSAPRIGIVGNDEQDVRRALWRHDARRPPWFRLQSVILDHAAEVRIGRRKLFSINRSRGAGRSRNAGYFLSPHRRGKRASEPQLEAIPKAKKVPTIFFIDVNSGRRTTTHARPRRGLTTH